MSNQLQWGILGTGNIAHQFAAGVTAATRSKIIAVGSRAQKTADDFAQEYAIKTAYDSYDALLADENVQAVYISLPNHMHYEWTIKALKAGKHILCEKPFASNFTEAEEMFQVANENKLHLVEAYMYRSHPQTKAVIEHIRSGAIGELTLIKTSFSFRVRNTNNVRFNTDMAGGALMDIGCYCIDFSNLLADCEPDQFHCAGHLHETGVDDMAAGSISYPNGIVASFACGMMAQTNNTATLCGTEGYIEIPVPWKPSDGGLFYICTMTAPRQDSTIGQGPSRREVIIPADKPLYALEADDFAETVLDNKPRVVTEAQTLATMKVLDQMRRELKMDFPGA